MLRATRRLILRFRRAYLCLREVPGELCDWSRVRAPLSDADVVLLSSAHHWLRLVPRSLMPIQLCRHHPRLANRLAQTWHDAVVADAFLRELMVDRRGDRRGFAPRVVAEIARIQRYNAQRLLSPARIFGTAAMGAGASCARAGDLAELTT